MVRLTPSSDGASSGVTAVGADSLWEATRAQVVGDPGYALLASTTASFVVALAGYYGKGAGVLTYRAKGNGPEQVKFTFYEAGVQVGAETTVTPGTFEFVQGQFATPAFVGGSALTLKVSAVHSLPEERSQVSFLEVYAPSVRYPYVVQLVKPRDSEDARAGGYCAKTRMWCPAHDLVYVPGVGRVSKTLYGPMKGRGEE